MRLVNDSQILRAHKLARQLGRLGLIGIEASPLYNRFSRHWRKAQPQLRCVVIMPAKRKADTSVSPSKKGKAKKAEDKGAAADAGAGELVNPRRWRELKGGSTDKEGPVIYWMSRTQRAADNWALLHACELAGKGGVAVAFNLVPEYLNAGARQFSFMLRGLQKMEPKLAALNIPFFMLRGDPIETIPKLVKGTKASALVTEFASLRLGREWREKVAEAVDVPFHEVEAHNTVPTWLASNKRETGARTLRGKIHKALPEFLTDFPEVPKQPAWSSSHKAGKVDWEAVIKEATEKGKDVPECPWLVPGEDEAMKALNGKDGFMNAQRLQDYSSLRNNPVESSALSGMSAFLHFGHISQQRLGFEIDKMKSKAREGAEGFLEELLVRAELAENFCYYEPNYDSIEAAAAWAKDSLEKHKSDKREYTYTREEWERAETHDELWNAAQREMVKLGKMHGFMRMYWGKKILEWSATPEEALEISIYLNDKYELDGRDPNGYVGCMWSVCGIHDQGWGEREVFGKVRYMNLNGCKRKFNVQAYIDGVNKRIKEYCKE